MFDATLSLGKSHTRPRSRDERRQRSFDAVYQQQHDYVRRALRGFGVTPADLDDLCHEVFLIVYRQQPERSVELGHVRPWLFEICRRVAAGYRRRRFRRSEMLVADPGLFAEMSDAIGSGKPGAGQKLGTTLQSLEPQQRELLLLHALADVSLSDLAFLAGCDRKTARKRLSVARVRLARLLNGDKLDKELVASATELEAERLFDPSRVAADASEPDDSTLKVKLVTPFFAAATWRSVFMTVWRRASLIEMEALAVSASEAFHAAGGKFAYLTLVEKDCSPPEFGARQRVLEILKEARPYLGSYSTVLNGGASRLAVPIMNVFFFLAGVEFPTRFFGSIAEAAVWTVSPLQERPDDAGGLTEAMGYLRALRVVQA